MLCLIQEIKLWNYYAMWGDFSPHFWSDTWGDALGDFLDNFEPILHALDFDTAFIHRALGKGYLRSCFFLT